MQRTNTVKEGAALILKARCLEGREYNLCHYPSNEAYSRGLRAPISVETECLICEEGDGKVLYYCVRVGGDVIGHILALHPHGEAHPEDVYVSYM